MYRCLDKEQLKQLVFSKLNNTEITNDLLKDWIDAAESWQDELGGLTYFFSQIVERVSNEGGECHILIETLYQLEQQMSFQIEEFSPQFIQYILRNLRTEGLSLENELVELQSKHYEHNYEHTLCY